jgi:hypothetical protein
VVRVVLLLSHLRACSHVNISLCLHLCRCVLYYALYVAGQTYLSQLFYDQQRPGAREQLLFAVMMMYVLAPWFMHCTVATTA